MEKPTPVECNHSLRKNPSARKRNRVRKKMRVSNIKVYEMTVLGNSRIHTASHLTDHIVQLVDKLFTFIRCGQIADGSADGSANHQS